MDVNYGKIYHQQTIKTLSMKILFTTFSFYPETSGVPVVVQYLAEGLVGKGHEVSVATCMNGHEYQREEFMNGIHIFRFNWGQTLTKMKYGEFENYIKFVINFPKDVLILECLQCHTTDILLPYLDQMDCKKAIHTHGAPGILMKPFGWEGDILHTIGHTHNWLRWKNYYGSFFPKHAIKLDAGICLSLCASDMDYLNKYLNRVFIAENAANDIFFDKTQYTEDISGIIKTKNTRYIVNISNYSDRKNQILLMKSFEQSGIKDVSLVLIGSKPNSYYKKCVAYATKLRNEYNLDILVLHSVDRKYFPSIIHHADLFVMTSKWEEYPVSLVEAMAVGTPFLSTQVGNAHILPGGITSRYNKEIPSLLKTLLNNSSMLTRYGNMGKEYALSHNTQGKVVDVFENILKNL